MTVRVDSSPLISNSVVIGVAGLGIRGEDLPTDGQDGNSILFELADLPAENDVEFRMLVTSQPSVGTLTTFEDGSFIWDAPVGTSDSFTVEWFKDGVTQGSETINVTIGASGLDLEPNLAVTNSVALNPALQFGGGLSLEPNIAVTHSISNNPLLTYNGGLELEPSIVQTFSEALRPILNFNQDQRIESITVTFADNPITVTFKE